MPQFPRFTSGSVGRLTFDVVNDLFARVESLEASRKENRTGTEQLGYPIMLAKVLEVRAAQGVADCLEAKWVEQASSPCGGVDMDVGGRRSGTEADPWEFPIYGNGLEVGQIVAIFANYAADGRLFYRTVGGSAGGGGVAARIKSAAVITANVAWRYEVELVEWNGSSWQLTDPQTILQAVNGCESMPDPTYPTTATFGVGFVPPAGLQQLVRLPIRNGIVVSISGTASPFFAVPNGYLVTCA